VSAEVELRMLEGSEFFCDNRLAFTLNQVQSEFQTHFNNSKVLSQTSQG